MKIKRLQLCIKLCPQEAQTCVIPLFCDHDLELTPMTLKLEDDLDVLKMYPDTENEAASLRHSNLELELKKCVMVKGQG